ncbi:hypothetical protein F6Q07_18945 [Pectobacterium parmentieri]|nr:hypothetical protein [Pectobacterium parmentieri]MBI0520185.1 hypothetical protein [Pectobacterium parmentieri]
MTCLLRHNKNNTLCITGGAFPYSSFARWHLYSYISAAIYDGFTVIRRKKLCSSGHEHRVSGMDAAKASAASDKNVRDVFEQHSC